jgi:hypothetical protein
MKSLPPRLLTVLLALLSLSAERAYAFYDPGVQRWLNRDPVGEEVSEAPDQGGPRRKLASAEARLGPNLYTFVKNRPLHQIDYLGLSPVVEGLEAICATPIAGTRPRICDPTSEVVYKSPTGRAIQKVCNYECTGGGGTDELPFPPRRISITVPPDKPCPKPSEVSG